MKSIYDLCNVMVKNFRQIFIDNFLLQHKKIFMIIHFEGELVQIITVNEFPLKRLQRIQRKKRENGNINFSHLIDFHPF